MSTDVINFRPGNVLLKHGPRRNRAVAMPALAAGRFGASICLALLLTSCTSRGPSDTQDNGPLHGGATPTSSPAPSPAPVVAQGASACIFDIDALDQATGLKWMAVPNKEAPDVQCFYSGDPTDSTAGFAVFDAQPQAGAGVDTGSDLLSSNGACERGSVQTLEVGRNAYVCTGTGSKNPFGLLATDSGVIQVLTISVPSGTTADKLRSAFVEELTRIGGDR